MNAAMIERVRDCVRSDRLRRDYKMREARYLHSSRASVFHVRVLVNSARIASRTAVQRIQFLRGIGL